LWIEDTALECWQTCGPGGQPRYSDAAVQASLVLRTAFKLPLRQTEGLLASVLTLMKLTISEPDHTTVSRRAVKSPVIQQARVLHGALHVLIDSTGLQVYGAGQWLEAKHGAKSRRKWRKLHLAVDADSEMIVAQTLTDRDADDPSQVALVRLPDGGRDAPSPSPSRDCAWATDGSRVSGRQHAVQDRHANRTFILLGSDAACPQPRSD
jgi:hypothetical protein